MKQYYTQKGTVCLHGKFIKPGTRLDAKKLGKKTMEMLRDEGLLETREVPDELPENEKTVSVNDPNGSDVNKVDLDGLSFQDLLDLCAEKGADAPFKSKKECIEYLTKNAK